MKDFKCNLTQRMFCVMLAIAVVFSGLCIPQNAKTVEAASPVVEQAISWAISIANDNSHGYSMTSRWGPDYDCSSFVISAFRNAGVNVGSATYTGNMRSQFTQHGFQWIPWSQIGGTSNLQRGDILLNDAQHTEIYLGNNQNVGAHSAKGHPETGDQTGNEISVSGYYNHPWNGVLRYISSQTCNCSTDYAGDYYVSTNSLPLTMRSGHGTGYSVVTSIPKGSTVHVSRANGSWAHVEWNGHSGYCSMQYLTRVSSKSYNLHVWVSDAKMGEVPSDFEVGNRYYICYELIDESTGKRASETSNISYNAKETVRNSKGTIFEYTYPNSDNNWISFVCEDEDTYTGTVTISGNVDITCSVSFNVRTASIPQAKIWLWNNNEGKEIDSVTVGENVKVSYLIRDKISEKDLNDVTSKWTQGDGYVVTVKVYDPNNNEVKSKLFKNEDRTWTEFTPLKTGQYKIKVEISGTLSGTLNKTLTVDKKVVPTTTPKPTATATPTVTPESTPKATPTVTPESTPKATPTVTPESTPKATPTITPESTPKATPTVTPELTPIVTPTVAPTPVNSPLPDKKDWKDTVKSALSKLHSFIAGEDEDEFTDEIKVGKISLKYVKNLKGRKLLLRWNKDVDVDGYQIEYSTNRKFKNSTVSQAKRTSGTIRKLDKNKKYYVRVRAYKWDDGEKVFGKWSKIKKITVKR